MLTLIEAHDISDDVMYNVEEISECGGFGSYRLGRH